MKNSLTIFIGILLVVVLLVYMVTFQVQYNEVAVLATFEKVDAPGYADDGTLQRDDDGNLVQPGSVIETPGIYFHWPGPVQRVYKYPTRIHILDDQLEEMQTSDNYSIIVRLYVAWTVDDPYQFYSNPKSINVAEERVRALTQDLRRIINGYNFDQLVNVNADRLKLTEIEDKMRDQLSRQVRDEGYGGKIENGGIGRSVLPEKGTEKELDRTRKTRERMAADIEADGKARAATIVSEAESIKSRILTFAESRAQAIRTEGDVKAAESYKVFQADEEFGIFLRKLETMKKVMGNNTTFIIDLNEFTPMNLFPEKLLTEATTPPAAATE